MIEDYKGITVLISIYIPTGEVVKWGDSPPTFIVNPDTVDHFKVLVDRHRMIHPQPTLVPGMQMCEFCGHVSGEACSTCGLNICTKCGRHEGEPEVCKEWV